MTQVRFQIDDNRLTGFEISGHSGFALEGSDIVCAAISSAAIMAANTVTEIIGGKADITENEGYLRFSLIDTDVESVKVLEGLRLHLMQISEQYPDNIKIIYGGKQNA
jgi:uncharacterized protein YsxB (DUF464 family)